MGIGAKTPQKGSLLLFLLLVAEYNFRDLSLEDN